MFVCSKNMFIVNCLYFFSIIMATDCMDHYKKSHTLPEMHCSQNFNSYISTLNRLTPCFFLLWIIIQYNSTV